MLLFFTPAGANPGTSGSYNVNKYGQPTSNTDLITIGGRNISLFDWMAFRGKDARSQANMATTNDPANLLFVYNQSAYPVTLILPHPVYQDINLTLDQDSATLAQYSAKIIVRKEIRVVVSGALVAEDQGRVLVLVGDPA